MSDRLVTIATFDQPAKARLAQNELTAAGIKSVVADETTVAMDWLLGNAIGWVKVQVLEGDAERAVTVLEEALGTDEKVDEDELAAEAEAARAEEEADKTPAAPSGAPAAPASEPVPPGSGAPAAPSERDEYARRLLFCAVFGLVVPLLWFYAVYLFLNAAFGEGPLSARGKKQLKIGGLLLLIGTFMAYFLFRLYGDPFW